MAKRIRPPRAELAAHISKGLTAKAIARIYGVEKGTPARWAKFYSIDAEWNRGVNHWVRRGKDNSEIEDDVSLIWQLKGQGLGKKKVASKFEGITPSMVNAIWKRKTWRHITGEQK